MKRKASADEVFQTFDSKIEEYLKKNRQAIEKEYRTRAARPVADGELDSFFSGLGDRIYDGIALDPTHLSKFVDFYINDAKLQGIVSEAVDKASEYNPARAASDILRIADAVDAARRPSLSKVSSAVSRVLSRLG